MKQLISLFCIFLLTDGPVLADLVATVQPGHTFATGERPTADTLNELGMPTITITGTVDGSTGLAAGSVTGTLLADSVPDGITIVWNGNTPRQLVVNTPGLVDGKGGIVSASSYLALSLDPAYFGLATNNLVHTNSTTGSPNTNWVTLAAGGGTAIVKDGLNAPSNTLFIAGGTNSTPMPLYLSPSYQIVQQTNVLGGVTNIGATFSPTLFTSGLYSVNSGKLADVAHGFSNAPVFVRWVMVCQASDAGYAIGDEVDVAAFVDVSYQFVSGINVATSPVAEAFSWGANKTNVFISCIDTSSMRVDSKTGGQTSVTPNNWKLKCYARP